MLLFVSILVSAIYLLFIIKELKKNKKFNFFLIISIMFFFVYALIPLIFSFSWYVFKHSFQLSGKSVDIAHNEWLLILYYLMALLGYMLFVLAYKTKLFKKKTLKNNEFIITKVKNVDNKNQNLVLQIVSWICLTIGVICFILWTNAYGGIFSTVKNSNAIRSQTLEIVNKLSFFKRPTMLVIIALFSFETLVIKSIKEKEYKIVDIIGLLLSFIISILYLLANDGRLTIILCIVAIIFIVFNFIKIKPLKFAIFSSVALIVLALLIISLDSITHFIRSGVWIKSNSNIIESLLSEFVFLPKGAETVIKKSIDGKLEFFFLNDFINAIFAWIPSKLKPIQFADVWTINTINIFGLLGKHGIWPCDLITQSLYYFGFLGVFVLPFMFGKCVKLIDDLLEKATLFNIITKAWLIIIFIRIVPYFSMTDVALSLFPLVIFILIYVVINKIVKELSNKK